MLRILNKNTKKAQTLIEYSIILGIVILAVFAMSTATRRTTQTFIKEFADQIGNQLDADQRFDEDGHLEESIIVTRPALATIRRDQPGNVGFIYSDALLTERNTLINMGFTENSPF